MARKPAKLAVHPGGVSRGVYVYDGSAIPWRSAGRDGLALRPVRYDDRGLFLGMVGMEPCARTGLHQHQGVASSFFVDGSLVDYYGPAGVNQVGINLKGATHDAIAYQRTLLVSRLEGPVTYPPEAGPLHQLHAGAHRSTFVNPAPEVPPDINVSVDTLPCVATGCAGVTRRDVFDYAGTGSDHRLVQLSLLPGTELAALETGALTELWVRAGAIELDGHGTAHANCFVIAEPGARLAIRSPFGALLLAWAEGPSSWLDRPERAELFGFRGGAPALSRP